MHIGKKPKQGAQMELGKWYIGLEILAKHPMMIRSFRPYLLVWCVKILDYGDPEKSRGREVKKIGGYRDFVSPIGIFIEIDFY